MVSIFLKVVWAKFQLWAYESFVKWSLCQVRHLWLSLCSAPWSYWGSHCSITHDQPAPWYSVGIWHVPYAYDVYNILQITTPWNAIWILNPCCIIFIMHQAVLRNVLVSNCFSRKPDQEILLLLSKCLALQGISISIDPSYQLIPVKKKPSHDPNNNSSGYAPNNATCTPQLKIKQNWNTVLLFYQVTFGFPYSAQICLNMSIDFVSLIFFSIF